LIVVLDTNVWISGLQFAKHYGMPTRAIESAMTRDVIATCSEIEEEIHRVLTEKFRWQPSQAHAALDIVLARAIRVQLRGNVNVCRDSKDDTCFWNVRFGLARTFSSPATRIFSSSANMRVRESSHRQLT
jgi:putative PIN family toxin of toxin-antitoxin system